MANAKAVDLSRIAVPPQKSSITSLPPAVEEKVADLTPEEEDEVVYQRVLKRKRQSLDEDKKNEDREKEKQETKNERIGRKISFLQLWYNSFTEVLKPLYEGKKLGKMSEEDLDDMLEQAKTIVGALSQNQVTDQTGVSLVSFLGDFVEQYFGLSMRGPAIDFREIATSKECSNLVKEIILNNTPFIVKSPEVRMFAYMLNALYAVNSVNSDALKKAKALEASKPKKSDDGTEEREAKKARVEETEPNAGTDTGYK